MGDQRRWAARYQFLDELWRGRDRIVCDPDLEAALHAGSEGPVAALVDGLVPGDGQRQRAWVALHNDRRAASFARAHSGTVFVSVTDASEIASDEPWQIALVHLGGGSTRAALVGPLESLLEVLGERLEDDPERTVVLSLACGPDEDQSYEQLAELVEELFGDGRIYGLAPASMAAFYDFGPVLEGTESESGSESGPDSGEGDIEVDNTLGSETPRFEAFLAIIGAGVPGEGVTFVELPGSGAGSGGSGSGGSGSADADAQAGDDELAAVRAQLLEAQRRGDLQAIERQSLLEQLEQAEDRIASLEEQLDDAAARASADGAGAELRSELAPADAGARGGDLGPRIDALLARERTLRWELERARGELERLEARPVDEAEAELAALRAELDQTRAELDLCRSGAVADGTEGTEGDLEPDELDALAELAWMLDEPEDAPTPAQTREWERARSSLDHLLRKLERGASLSALELHRQLAALKRLL